jgi:hypothetical protein
VQSKLQLLWYLQGYTEGYMQGQQQQAVSGYSSHHAMCCLAAGKLDMWIQQFIVVTTVNLIQHNYVWPEGWYVGMVATSCAPSRQGICYYLVAR